MPKYNPPENFNFNNPADWPDWKQRFSRNRTATKLDKGDATVQISSLVYAMGREAEHILNSFVFNSEDDAKKYNVVMTKFIDYFVSKRNVFHERARFHQRAQLPGEAIESFVRSMYEIAKNCTFRDKKRRFVTVL